MKHKSTAFRYLYVLVVLLLLFPLSLIVNAQEAKLTTVVPSVHRLSIDISGKGFVCVDGIEYSKTTEIQIARFASPLIDIKAASNHHLDSVLYNGEDITKQISKGKWTIPSMIDDAVIKVDFDPESDIPATGDTSNICLWLILMLVSFIGLIVCYWTGRKEKKQTEYS